MKPCFTKVGLVGKLCSQTTADTCSAVVDFLATQPVEIYLDHDAAESVSQQKHQVVAKNEIGKYVDLVIVVGGDGSLLHAARSVIAYDTPIIGINRGRLGFLTDIKPSDIATKLAAMLNGEYKEEKRFLLEGETSNQSTICSALNDIVLASHDNAHMMEFEVYINNSFMCSERADGMIIATPTGSTAYALSGGGPIVQPTLDAIVLVPMFSHTLTSRPIVVPGDSQISLVIGEKTDTPAKLSVDGQVHCMLNANESVTIKKKQQHLRLLHPTDYDYFDNVRSKLHWGKKLDLAED